MTNTSNHIQIRRSVQVFLFIGALLCHFSGWSQSETPPPVEEVVLDSLSFRNGDTTVKDLDEEESDYANDETTVDTSSETIIFRSVPDSVAAALKKSKEFEYANDPRYWVKKKKQEQSNNSSFNWNALSNGIKFFMYLLLISALLFVIYRLVVTNNLFYTKSKKLKQAAVEEDIEMSDENIDRKIEEAVNAGNLRLATRFSFIKTLKLLDNKGWIRYHPQATNYDYLNQVSQYRVAGDFAFVTRIYEYVWYGEFEINQQQFEKVKPVFEKIFNEAR